MELKTTKFFVSLLLCLVVNATCAEAKQRAKGVSPPDPFTLMEPFNPSTGNNATINLTPRTQIFNPAARNLALIVVGQSNCASILPTVTIPSASVDQFNIYDGGSYNFIAGAPLLGAEASDGSIPGSGYGSVATRLAQLFITNNKFDHVVVSAICIGATPASGWAGTTGSGYYLRIPVILKRFISRGMGPGATGWTVAISWWQGEQDNAQGTTSASYQSSMNLILANAQGAGFNCATCRFFVNVETLLGGNVSSAVQSAQAAVVAANPTKFFAGGNIDTLTTTTNRLSDLTHLNDTGAKAAAVLVYNAMVASGAPF